MKKVSAITALLLLLSLLLLNQHLSCEEDAPVILWTLEPHTDRSVHVKAAVSLVKSTDSHKLLEVPEEVWIKNVRAYESTSGEWKKENRLQSTTRESRSVMRSCFS